MSTKHSAAPKLDHRISRGEREYWIYGPVELTVSRWGNRQGWDWRVTNNNSLVFRGSNRKKTDATRAGKEALRSLGDTPCTPHRKASK